MANRKIKFLNLIESVNSGWWDEREFNAIHWILNTGKEFDTYYNGIHKAIYNYSAYNHNNFVGFLREDHTYILSPLSFHNVKARLMTAFVNAFVLKAPPNSPLDKWRKKERIYLNGFRMLDFNNERPEMNSDSLRKSFDLRHEIWLLHQLQGKKLKKEKCQPEYENRVNPFIRFIDFSCFAAGWNIKLHFSFDGMGDSNWWSYDFYQQNESVANFFFRVNTDIKTNWLLES